MGVFCILSVDQICVYVQPVENRGHWTPEITVMSHLLVLETEPRSSERSVSDLNH